MSNDKSESAGGLFPLPDIEELNLVQILKAVADPARMIILERLSDDHYHPCNLTDYRLGIHKATLSHHFKVLREAGLTRTRVQGREHSVQLRRDGLEQRWPGLIDALLSAAIKDQPAGTSAPDLDKLVLEPS